MPSHPTTLAVAVLFLAPVLHPFAAPGPAGKSPALDGTAWILSALPGQLLLPDRKLTLRFEGGKVQWSDGCNGHHAAYTMESGRFRLSPGVTSTLMKCPPEVIKQAGAFTSALYGARTLRIEGKQLSLVGEVGTVLATLGAQRQDVRGTVWQVTGVNNGKQAVVSVAKGSMLTMEFSADGTLGGSAGCNRYTGPYSAEGDKVSVGDLATTRKMCARPEHVMEQEGEFLEALRWSATARIDGDRLELRDAVGALMVTATASPGASRP